MDSQRLSTSIAPEVFIEQIDGNLSVKGWERPEVVVFADADELSMDENDDIVQLECKGNCDVRMPHNASLQIGRVAGDARVKFLEEKLKIDIVHGSLTLRDIEAVQVETVHGDLTTRGIQAGMHVSQVNGNTTVRNVLGNCILDDIEGNLDLRDVDGEVHANIQGNAHVSLSQINGVEYHIQAQGNIVCHIPGDASAQLNLSSQAEVIQVRLPDVTDTFEQAHWEYSLGAGEASMSISSGGTITLVAYKPARNGNSEPLRAHGVYIGDLPTDVSFEIAQEIETQITAQIDAMTRQLSERMASISEKVGKAGLSPDETERIMEQARRTSERETSRAQAKMRRAQEKLERKLETALRRSEFKSKAANRRTSSHTSPVWQSTRRETPPADDPVSDEERLMILKMLEQKKITLAEAENLLSALESKA